MIRINSSQFAIKLFISFPSFNNVLVNATLLFGGYNTIAFENRCLVYLFCTKDIQEIRVQAPTVIGRVKSSR